MVSLITKPKKFVRVRVLIYTHETYESLDRQRRNDGVQRVCVWGPNRVESYELNPLRMTLLELIRLWWREGKRAGKESV